MRVQNRLRKVIVDKMLKGQKNACYVLITCGEPTDDGKMQVELTYEGDSDLASYLVDAAQSYLEEEDFPLE